MSGPIFLGSYLQMNRRQGLRSRAAVSIINPGTDGVSGLFPRIREIADAFDTVVRISVEPHPGGALVIIDRPDLPNAGKVMLDAYGAEILVGFIMSARLAVPGEMPTEEIGGAFPTRFQLDYGPDVSVIIDQLQNSKPFHLPEALWDRTYAEMCIVCAHARELERRRVARVH